MNRKFKAAAWAVLLILFVLSGVIVHAQDETMSTNTPESILEETSKEAIIEEGGKSVEVLFDASKDLVNEAVQADAANEGDKNAEGNGEQAEAPAEKDAQGQTGYQTEEPEANAEGEAEVKPVDPADVPAEGEQADSEVKTAEGNTTPTEKAEDPKTEEGKNALEDSGDKKPEAVGEGNPEGGATGEPKPGANQPTQPEEGAGAKPEYDPSGNDELNELQKQIDEAEKAKDEKAKADLQAQYNKKYWEELGKSEKLGDEILNRITDEDKTKQYYELKEEYEALNKKGAAGTLTKKEIDAFNKKLGEYKVPRLLDDDEKAAAEKVHEAPSLNGLQEGATEDAKKIYDDYVKAKEALEAVLNPDNDRTTTPEKLAELVKAFNEAEAKFKAGLGDGSIKPNYTKDGTPEIRLYPFTGSGQVGKELDEETYYIPDGTDLNLLVQVNKDKGTPEGDFTFKIKTLADEGQRIPKENLSKIAFLNGKPVDLEFDEDGGFYYFKTTADQDFGVAQIKFNMKGFKGAFHKGFSITMSADGTNDVTKEFLLTKKGYENDADISGIGNKDEKNPQKDVDAGDTENGIVKEDTDKVFDFFAYLKKSNVYINEVLVNSSNGASLPLSSVEITITLPKYNDTVAEYIHKSDLKYHDNGDGTYTLKLDAKTFEGNKDFKVKDGKLYYKDDELTNENITNAILEGTDKKVYIGEDKKEYTVLEKNILEDNGHFKVIDNQLYRQKGGKYEFFGTFDKDKKVTKDGITFELRGNTLLGYTDVKDVYKGKVTNEGKDEKAVARPDINETYYGKQVKVITEETDSEGNTTKKTSYGGTIVKDPIFENIAGKKVYFIDQGNLTDQGKKKYTGKALALISSDGKRFDTTEEITAKDIQDGKKDIDGVEYKVVENAVFNEADYILEGLSFREGLTVIDKFGRLMPDIKVIFDEDTGKYTFEKGKDKKTSDDSKIKVEEGKVFVNGKNEVVTGDYHTIAGKYYYDGKKFVKAYDSEVKDGKLYVDLLEKDLDKKIVEYYKNGDKEIELPGDAKRYYGGTNKDNIYKIRDNYYYKVEDGQGTYLVKADGKGDLQVISENGVTKIIQTKGDDEFLTKETDIFEAIKKAQFSLKFPGFLAGKDVVYHLDAKVAAKYLAPEKDKKGNEVLVPKSIFKDENNKEAKYKEFSKYFTLKRTDFSLGNFFKSAPDELKQKLDYNFFNIFFRDYEHQSERDEYVIELLKKEDKGAYKDEKLNDESLSKKEKAKLEEEKHFLGILRNALKKIKPNARFKYNEGNKLWAEYEDKEGNVVKIDRSLLWEIGFKNEGGILFPEDTDTEIIIEDHSMDNRLVYDEIIVNDTKAKWNDLEAEFKKDEANKDKKFGNNEYFFLDQIKDIRFGVSPAYIDGRFVPLGENFKITGQEIIDKLGDKDSATITTKGGIEIKITRDTANGQVRIKVMNAFYKKVKNDDTHKFYSPAQKEYQKKMKTVLTELEGLNSSSDTKELSETMKKVIEGLHAEKTECHGILVERFEKLIKEIDDIKDEDEKTKRLNEVKDKLQEEIKKLNLEYLDKSKGDYANDDMRFNAIRIGLKPNLAIGGAIEPIKTKKFGLTSVIVPDVDIPYTDEFGNALKNKDMYVKEEIEKIIREENFIKANNITPFDKDRKPIWDKSEDSFVKVMKEAYRRVNESNNEFKTLVDIAINEKYGHGRFTVKKGSDFEYRDLAVDGKESIKDSNGNPINPWWIGEGEKAKKLSEKIDNDLQGTDEYKKLAESPIDLAAYYMSNKGYGRAKYANFANYKLDKEEQLPGIFGEDNSWRQKKCYPSIGFCIDQADGGDSSTSNKDGGKYGAQGETNKDFELTYEPTPKTPDEEHPGLDKKSETKNIDLSEKEKAKEGEEAKEGEDKYKEHDVNFEIDITVDKKTYDQKRLEQQLKPDGEEVNEKDYKDGYYIYKDALILDILPDIFKVTDKFTYELNIDKAGLMKNGANAGFNKDETFNTWKDGIEYLYTEDVLKYLEGLKKSNPDRAAVLEKALEARGVKGKQQVILAWLPEFQAPHGSKNQFKFKLNNLRVDRKKYKEAEDLANAGQPYTNHAVFGNKAEFFFGKHDITITDGHKGRINKYLQILDKDGKVITDDEEAQKYYKGGYELKFGDKFNYKIKYYQDKGLIQTPANPFAVDQSWSLEDIFAKVGDKGLRPVLFDFVKVPDGFEVIYTVGKTNYTEKELKDAIEKGEASLDKVEKINIKGDYPDKTYQEFILPMMIPELDAKIVDDKVVYIGTDGKEHELGDAKNFFNLKDLTDKEKDLIAENTVEGSNTVTVYLEKERFIKVFKKFLESDGKTEIKKDRPEIRFDVYQIIDKDGKKTRVKLKDQLIVNEDNNFEAKIDKLPIYKETKTLKDGKAVVEITNYEYELEEVVPDGYESEVIKLEDKDGLGFVWKATNTEKPEEPENPGDNPKEEPKEVKVTIKVNKVWKVLNGGSTPSIQVELYANGKATGKIITLGDGNWSASFKDLPVKDKDGNEIIYTVREVGEADYITEIDDRKFEVSYVGDIKNGFTITNEEIPEEPEKPKTPEPKEPGKPDEPKTPEDQGGGRNTIPKTGVRTDLRSIFFSGILLLALFFFKRKFFKN